MSTLGRTIAYPSAPRRALPSAMTRAAQLWSDLGAPVTGRRVAGTVPIGVAAAVVALAASAWLVPSGWSLAYSDAQSHLTIARRLFDTLSEPGLGQLGTVWLPIPHLLLVPFVLSLWAWHTGWGAAFLGALCLAVTAAGCYRAAARWGYGRAARLTVIAALLSNPTLLYLTSTALTEPVLIASMAASLAGLAFFTSRTRLSSAGELAIFAGLPAAAAVMSRYEGWAITLTGALYVALVAWRRTNGNVRVTIARTAGFSIPPALAACWWLAYNWVVFHNPLEFLTGEYSANAQQAGMVASGDTTKGDLTATLATLGQAVNASVGPALLGLAGVGVILALTTQRRRNRLAFIVVAATSFLFLVVALYTGQAVIWNTATGETYIWNNRFGMPSILPAALLAGLAVDSLARRGTMSRLRNQAQRVVAIAGTTAAALALLAQAGWFLQAPAERSFVITEASVSLSRGADSRAAAAFLADNYNGGRVLLDETAWTNAVLPQIGLPLVEYYLRADGVLFTEALADPAGHARWVWSSTTDGDQLAAVTGTTSFQHQYERVFANAQIQIFRMADR